MTEPRHLTARALHVLQDSLYDDKGVMVAPGWISACRGEFIHSQNAVRAGSVTVYLREGTPISTPTCPECSVLWDTAMERR